MRRYLRLTFAALALFALPACQGVQPKARLAVEAPPDAKGVNDIRCKLEVTLD
jgi:hypothetical protein